MTVYVYRDGRHVSKRTGEPMLSAEDRAKPIAAPMVATDLPAYVSPLGDGVIDGRYARREHMKRTNTREVDPSEFKATSEQFQSTRAEKQAAADAWKAGKDIKRGTA